MSSENWVWLVSLGYFNSELKIAILKDYVIEIYIQSIKTNKDYIHKSIKYNQSHVHVVIIIFEIAKQGIL